MAQSHATKSAKSSGSEVSANLGPRRSDPIPCNVNQQPVDWDGFKPEAGIFDAITVNRFLAKVNQQGAVVRPELGPCFLWTSSVAGPVGFKYGQFVLPRLEDGRQPHIAAHRFSWMLAHGPVPKGQFLCHHCDTPRCVRPSHLFLGSQKDNLDDARRKGRLKDGAHLIKLSDADLLYIRATYRRGNGKALAAQFGVSLITIMRVLNGTQRVHQTKATRLQQEARALDLSPVLEHVAYRVLPIVGEVW